MDKREIKIRQTLSQLTNFQLKRILNYDGQMIFDTYNYEPETKRY